MAVRTIRSGTLRTERLVGFCVALSRALTTPVVDLGTFDGEQISMPTNVDGDGRPEYIIPDNSFLYTSPPMQ